MCFDDPVCSTPGMKTFILKHFIQPAFPYPIGIALDGHIIWGPFKDETTVFDSCDVDICNGRVIGGQYGYVANIRHPYFVGCWGPGNFPEYRQQCTYNPRVC